MAQDKIKYPCRRFGCPETVERGKGYCNKHKPKDNNRLSSSSRGYSSRWQRARLSYLKSNPICRSCEAEPATVVDHIIPHKGDQELFWDINNWQALGKRCHDIKTATVDGGFGRKK